MFVHMLNGASVPGRAVVVGGGGGSSDGGFVGEPVVSTTVSGGTTINGKIKSGSFGKFVYPLATVAAGRQYTFRYTPHFAQLMQQGKSAMVGFGFKTDNDFHLVGLRGDGSMGLHKYKVYGTPPNGWNQQTGHTTSDGGASANGTQNGPNWIRLVISPDGTSYTFQTSPDGSTWTDEFTGASLSPFSNVLGVATFGVALWFSNNDAGPFSIEIDQFADAAAPTGDPYWANVVLLVGFDGADGATSATDDSLSAHSLTFNGNAQLDTGVSPPFGTASLLVDGSGDFVSTADSADFDFGSGNFTIEAFVRTVANANNQTIVSQYASVGSDNAWEMQANISPGLTGRFSPSGTSGTNVGGGTSLTATTWHHVCFERSGTKYRLYIDGTMVGSNTDGSALHNSAYGLRIGARDNNTGYFNGHIKEIRITKGVARYNSDSGFTAPTAAFPRG
ncbi:LamG domain-containing protein [Mesorhizobium sp.]|uniref:LamG domain-containing protein n=1 Tax=Mesorhizobium sp. TaxID=1871066 RepID=UPI000FE81CB7|nr:LamG domain-containing protein [Mesorhizobium sp.]RWG16723.1 MAG: LamG domain-containing protein [Mesorhizobium sp.]RWG33440.1 MAG: LamG domain-containing protein [Mesorhizobium sp.]RWH11600.1 MAG: LamG domain-containing protein [Mesorhizobium sp.]RWH26870.1 MAG: LamG domain-containing protein [Mesorhizobium sp.]TIN01928.1 MAG: LamG domain-containing protein [Mesorhizobium sp.]